MAAFDKICSGLPQMDEVLDYIRLGDNVVWQISELEEFRTFAEPFARQAVRDGWAPPPRSWEFRCPSAVFTISRQSARCPTAGQAICRS